jgi:hypothetical protein
VVDVTAGAVPASVDPFKVSHDGRLVAFQVNGDVPPLAASDCEYCTPEVVAGSDVVATVGSGLMVRLHVAGKTDPTESVADTLKEFGPATVGVPVMAPLPEFNCSPVGSAPPVTSQFLYGATPPFIDNVVE